MLMTPHVLSGMVFGDIPGSYLWAPALGLLSYFVLELIPHWDPEDPQKKRFTLVRSLDFGICFILFFLFSALRDFDAGVMLGGLFAGVPYLIFYIIMIFAHEGSIPGLIHHYKSKIKYSDKSVWGVIIQFAICMLAIAILFDLVDFPTWEKIREQFTG
jgi:hypothetical protein